MKIVDLITSIQTGDREIVLDIVVGDGQIGVSAVQLGEQIVATGHQISCKLGKGGELVGRVLRSKSMVTDVNDHSNRTSLEYIFRHGDDTQKFLSKVEVDNEGDAVMYRSVFTFT